jgi:hypothetical protein
MSRRTGFEIPAGLKDAQQRFEQWRSSQSGRRPIPEPLWVLAEELAGQHGVFRTAQVLRLDYNKLKQRTAATAHTPEATAASQEVGIANGHWDARHRLALRNLEESL